MIRNVTLLGALGFDPTPVGQQLQTAVQNHADRTKAQGGQRGDSLAGYKIARDDWAKIAQGDQPRKDAADWFGGLNENMIVGPDRSAKRNDAAGMFFERQLEYIDPKVLRQKYRPFNAIDLFPVDGSVPPGARKHTVRRLKEFGRAAIYRAGQQIPMVSMAGVEQQFPIHHIVCGFQYDIFDEQAADFANTSLYAELTGVSTRLINQRINELIWDGDVNAGLFGVLNYPYLNKKVTTTAYTTATTADAIIADFAAAADFPSNSTGATMVPTDVVLSVRLWNALMHRPRSTTTDTSILKWLMDHYPELTFHKAHELEDAGGTGIDGILFYSADPVALDWVLSQTPVVLPVVNQGLDRVAVAYASFGGVRMRDSGHNLLLLVPAV